MSKSPTPPSGGEAFASITIRPVVVDDCVQLEANLRDLNTFGGMDMTLPQLTAADLARDGFGEHPAFSCIVADCGGELVGCATYTHGWLSYDGIGRCLFLVDLFVREAARRRGVGRRLLQAVAAAGVRHGAPHIELSVCNWNEPALRFYRGLGCRTATVESQMLTYFCDRSAVHRLAAAYEAEDGTESGPAEQEVEPGPAAHPSVPET